MDVKIEQSWKDVLKSEFEKDYFKKLTDFVRREYLSGKTIYPEPKNIFNAFNLCPFDKVKVVIIGQDPYHEPGQAHGLCFSVENGVNFPPSLLNIYKEIESDIGHKSITNGDLSDWAKQGVLLLNSSLTVEAHIAASHSGKGWEIFTDAVIRAIAENKKHIVYILWGSFAQKKADVVNKNENLVLTSAHPSPLSAYRGFFGNHHFSKTNEYLVQNGLTPIDW
jgi:uracil-DNA glycosylase